MCSRCTLVNFAHTSVMEIHNYTPCVKIKSLWCCGRRWRYRRGKMLPPFRSLKVISWGLAAYNRLWGCKISWAGLSCCDALRHTKCTVSKTRRTTAIRKESERRSEKKMTSYYCFKIKYHKQILLWLQNTRLAVMFILNGITLSPHNAFRFTETYIWLRSDVRWLISWLRVAASGFTPHQVWVLQCSQQCQSVSCISGQWGHLLEHAAPGATCSAVFVLLSDSISLWLMLARKASRQSGAEPRWGLFYF